MATITCSHGGRVTLIPRQTTVLVKAGSVMCEPDLIGAPIVGCAQPASTNTKPCTAVLSTLPGASNPRVLVAGRPVYLQTLIGITDGVPPGVVTVAFAGHALVQG